MVNHGVCSEYTGVGYARSSLRALLHNGERQCAVRRETARNRHVGDGGEWSRDAICHCR